mgnify:FL=1
MTTREAFEAFISAPPFEMPTERFDDRCAWPGGYTELEVDLAWQAWQAAKATCPAWHDAPTVPGLWVHRQVVTGDTYLFDIIDPVMFTKNMNLRGRYYGPLPQEPEDKI